MRYDNEPSGDMKNISIDIIIPTFKPGTEFAKLLRSLALQVLPPDHLIVVNTEEAYWDKSFEKICDNMRVRHIKQSEFDHGTARHMAAASSDADILVFMTQDAQPADNELISKLIRPIVNKEAEISYARQLPKPDAGLIERFTRSFNYPAKSRVKSIKDTDELGIKTFFCSNVCAAYDKRIYDELGGFKRPVILNEDMLLAADAVLSGYRVSYTADAEVFHSHEYSWKMQFRRNFDIGTSQKQYENLFKDYPSVGEGKRMVKENAAYICKKHKYHLLFKLVWMSGWKLLGYSFGKRYEKLPAKLVKKWSLSPQYWDKISLSRENKDV